MTTNHQPLSASLAVSFAIHPPFLLLFGALKPPHPFPSPLAYRFGIPPFQPFFVFQSNSDPPNHQRLGVVHLFVTPPVHSFVNPIPVWRTDVCFIPRTFESSQYLFLSQPFVYKVVPSCLDYPHANNSTKLEIFIDPPASR